MAANSRNKRCSRHQAGHGYAKHVAGGEAQAKGVRAAWLAAKYRPQSRQRWPGSVSSAIYPQLNDVKNNDAA